MNRVAIIIVNYRTAALTLNCLASLAADDFSRGNASVIIVDNASGDDSPELIAGAIAKNGWSPWAKVLRSSDNRGFAAGNNLALQHLLHQTPAPAAEYLMLLNPDTLIHAGAVEALAAILDAHDRVGIVGSRLFDGSNVVQCAAHRFPSPLGELEDALSWGTASRLLSRWRVTRPASDAPHPCDWVSGAALMVRSQVVQQIGLLDQDFFLYFEEVDWCRRAKLAGWQIWHVPASEVSHLEGASTGMGANAPRSRHWQASHCRYFKKHHGVLGWWAAQVGRHAGSAGFELLKPFRHAVRAGTDDKHQTLSRAQCVTPGRI